MLLDWIPGTSRFAFFFVRVLALVCHHCFLEDAFFVLLFASSKRADKEAEKNRTNSITKDSPTKCFRTAHYNSWFVSWRYCSQPRRLRWRRRHHSGHPPIQLDYQGILTPLIGMKTILAEMRVHPLDEVGQSEQAVSLVSMTLVEEAALILKKKRNSWNDIEDCGKTATCTATCIRIQQGASPNLNQNSWNDLENL